MQKQLNTFDNFNINYDICRLSDKFLVFIHGAGGDLSAWEKIRQFFHKKGISTLAIDLRGHGLSDRPNLVENYKLDNFAKDIYSILKKEKLRDFVLVGHCFGGVVTIMFHKLYPKLAKAYILVNTTYEAPKKLRKIFGDFPFFEYILYNVLKNKKLPKKYSHADFSKFIGTGDWNIRRIYSDVVHTSLKSWLYTYKNLAIFDGLETIKSINKPTLIIGSEKDSILDVSVARRMHSLVKSSHLKIIQNANHIIVVNSPHEISNEIFHFVSSFRNFVNYGNF